MTGSHLCCVHLEAQLRSCFGFDCVLVLYGSALVAHQSGALLLVHHDHPLPPPQALLFFSSSGRHETVRRQKSDRYHEQSEYFTVIIEIKSKTHWILFQTFIETMFMMICLYVTIVLSSTLFLKATEASRCLTFTIPRPEHSLKASSWDKNLPGHIEL